MRDPFDFFVPPFSNSCVIPPHNCSLLFSWDFLFFMRKSGVLYLSSGVAPLLHPALLHCIFFSSLLPLSQLKEKTWRARLKLNKTPVGCMHST